MQSAKMLTSGTDIREDLHDLAMVAERRDDGTISLAGLKKACDVSGTDESLHALF
ncbi:MAG: hypothetical protein WCE46_05750 [Methanoregula sp.]|uniref:hypothetical protein n=1 Tax=Methanoregula sp. TaxID=2052170 RepID=UPI003C721949